MLLNLLSALCNHGNSDKQPPKLPHITDAIFDAAEPAESSSTKSCQLARSLVQLCSGFVIRCESKRCVIHDSESVDTQDLSGLSYFLPVASAKRFRNE